MISDVLLDDSRVERVEAQVRKEFPRLPEGAEFATWVQPAFEAEIQGIVRPVPEAAVFGIKVPNPRRPQFPKLHRASWPLRQFLKMEQSFDRLVNYPDPALHAFRAIAPNAINWFETMRDLTDPVEDFDDLGETGQLYSGI